MSRNLKRSLAIWAVSIFLIISLVVALGGIHHYTFSDYTPTAVSGKILDSGIRISVYPEFTTGGLPRLKSVIPNLYYRGWTPSGSPHIDVKAEPILPSAGRLGISKLVLLSLVVKNEGGHVFTVVPESLPETFSQLDLQNSYGRQRLGPVSGSVLAIKTIGYIVRSDGVREEFNQEQTWTETSSFRFGLGIFFASEGSGVVSEVSSSISTKSASGTAEGHSQITDIDGRFYDKY